MAGNQSARRDAHAFDINAWMAQRRADVQRLLQDAEAAGREFWAHTTRTGQHVSAPNPGDVLALGAQYLGFKAREKGGEYARRLGNAGGVARAGVNMARGVHDDVVLAGRILNPLDRVLNPPDQRPLQPIANTANSIINYVANAGAHPEVVARNAGNLLQKWNTELNPDATPQAATLGGELNRNFQIGMNQGEAAIDVAPLAFGVGGVKAVSRLLPISEAAERAKFLKQGFSPEAAARLARPYEGMGHHFNPRRFQIKENYSGVSTPKFLVGEKLPSWLSNSPFNVLKPRNISQGDFYELHYKVDPQFYGAAIKRGSPGWSGKALGLEDQRYGPLGRLWNGSPAPLNIASGVVGGVELTKPGSGDGDSR